MAAAAKKNRPGDPGRYRVYTENPARSNHLLPGGQYSVLIRHRGWSFGWRTLGAAREYVRKVGAGHEYEIHKGAKKVESGSASGTPRENPLPIGKLVTLRARRLKNGRVELYR